MSDVLDDLKDASLQLERRSFDSVDAGLAANVANAAIDEIERLRLVLRGIEGWRYHRLVCDEPWQLSDFGNAYSCGSQAAFDQCATLASGALSRPHQTGEAT